MTAPHPQLLGECERAEIEARLAELRAEQEAAPGWGAAVGVRHEEIKSLEGRLATMTTRDESEREALASELENLTMDDRKKFDDVLCRTIDFLRAAPVDGAREALADAIIADPSIVWLRECGFNSSAKFESTLRAAILRAAPTPDAMASREAVLVKALEKVRSYNVDIAAERINYRPHDHIQVIDEALAALSKAPAPQPFYGAQCPSYPACSGGCGLGCTHEIEARKAAPQPERSGVQSRDADAIALNAAQLIECLPSQLHECQRTARIQLLVLDAIKAALSLPVKATGRENGNLQTLLMDCSDMLENARSTHVAGSKPDEDWDKRRARIVSEIATALSSAEGK